MTSRRKVNWPWFILGCVFVVAALVAFFWAFSLRDLSKSQIFLLMWLLPLTSGFACGCFAGSLKMSGPVGNLAIAATGGFAVWLLSYFLLPDATDEGSKQELLRLLGERHSHILTQLDAAEARSEEPEKFQEFRDSIEKKLESMRDAYEQDNFVRARETLKDLIRLIDSDRSKKFLDEGEITEIRYTVQVPEDETKERDPNDPHVT